jgi:hypothetical protein
MTAHASRAPQPAPALTRVSAPALLRKCECGSGGSAGIDNKCESCRGDGKPVMRKAADGGPPRGDRPRASGGFDFGRLAVLPVSAPGDRAEVEAERAAGEVMRALAEGAADPPELHARPEPSLHRADAPSPPEAQTGGLIAEDDAALTAGQMHKTAFLGQLRSEACAAADAAMAATGRDTQGCPAVEKWITLYQGRDARHLERAILKYAPEARGASSAADYIPLVSARVARGAATWATTGRLPPDVPAELAAASPGDLLGAALGGVMGAISAAISGIGSAVESLGALFKGRGRDGVDGAALHDRLGAGRPLDSVHRGRMESAFGRSFADVRLHTDASAAALSRDLSAHAFTVGNHVAFAHDQYRPGTPAGDALLAHELAHVVQQQGAAPRPPTLGPGARAAAEDDADRSALGTVGALWGTPEEAARLRHSPRARTHLSLSRCSADTSKISDATLQAYLAQLDKTGKIENASDSDTKARAIVERWRKGGSDFVLTARRKALLIQEMQKGATTTDEEEAILDLLYRSYNFELKIMSTEGGLTVASLESDFGSKNTDRLQQFFNGRFHGGRDALLAGTVDPMDFPRELGQSIQRDADSEETIKGAVEGWNQPCVLGILCPLDKATVDALPSMDVRRAHINLTVSTFKDGAWHDEIRHPAGFNLQDERLVVINADRRCGSAAGALMHEVHHQSDPPGTIQQRELGAYTFEIDWEIQRGIPSSRTMSEKTPDNRVRALPEGIKKHVESQYPVSHGDEVIGKTDDGKTRLRRADKSEYTRPSEDGDLLFHEPAERPDEVTLDPKGWKCPDVPGQSAAAPKNAKP